MFCPKGTSVQATPGNPQTISLAGIDRDNLVVLVNAPNMAIVSMGGSVITTNSPKMVEMRVPASATSVTISTDSNGPYAEICLGTDF